MGLDPNEYAVIANLIVNGENHGQVPVVYSVPDGLTEDERREFALSRVAEITAMINERAQVLVRELDAGGRVELRLTDDGELAWLGQAPDTIEELL